MLAAWMRLLRHSRLRRAMLVWLGYAAVNRRDFDLAVRAHDPGYEYYPEQLALPDSDPAYLVSGGAQGAAAGRTGASITRG
jgi:hypothetical protein